MEKKHKKNENELLIEFNKLKTIKEKFVFWEKKLEVNYLTYLEYLEINNISFIDLFTENIHPLKSFQINPRNKYEYVNNEKTIITNNEREEYNNMVLNVLRKENNVLKDKTFFFNAEQMIKHFDVNLGLTVNKKTFFKNELQKVEVFLNNNIKMKNGDLVDGKTLFEFYSDFYVNKREVDLSVFSGNYKDLINAMNGIAIAKFKLYLEEKEEILNLPKKPLLKRKELSIKEQLLILEYFQIIKKIRDLENDSKAANFLSLLLNKDQQNIRVVLSKWEQFKSPKNKKEKVALTNTYNTVISIFEDLGMQNAVKDFSNLQKNL